jgi:hypothetical protein
MTFDFDTMLNHHLSKKLKLIGRVKFNHLTNTLTPQEEHNMLTLYTADQNCTYVHCGISRYIFYKQAMDSCA